MIPTRTLEQTTGNPAGLLQLEQALRRDFKLLDYPRKDWVIPHTGSDGKKNLDVLIIGGGQGGLAVAYGLLREKVSNILVIDQNPEGFEGPWRTFARMITLRTPKHLVGLDYGLPNLTFQAWYEAQYGQSAWESMQLIPKELWADYLHWYRTFLGIPVQNHTRAGAITWNPRESRFEVPVTREGDVSTLYARKIVLATGIDGSGQWQVPRFIRDNLSPTLYAHTRGEIDFDSLKGKRIAVLGAGASAFDNASVALETGACEVHLFFRRKSLVNINAYRWAEFVGFLNHHADLPDDRRWQFIRQIIRMGQLPPADTMARATQHENFYLHPGEPWEAVRQTGDMAQVTTPCGTYDFDFLIIGTGFVTDLSLRPELENLYPHIALWADRYCPPPGEAHEDLARHPYLGPHFEFQEKIPGAAPYLQSIFNYTFGCLVSLGFGGASISGLKYSLPRVVTGITRQLYLDNNEAYYQSLCQYDEREF